MHCLYGEFAGPSKSVVKRRSSYNWETYNRGITVSFDDNRRPTDLMQLRGVPFVAVQGSRIFYLENLCLKHSELEGTTKFSNLLESSSKVKEAK